MTTISSAHWRRSRMFWNYRKRGDHGQTCQGRIFYVSNDVHAGRASIGTAARQMEANLIFESWQFSINVMIGSGSCPIYTCPHSLLSSNAWGSDQVVSCSMPRNPFLHACRTVGPSRCSKKKVRNSPNLDSMIDSSTLQVLYPITSTDMTGVSYCRNARKPIKIGSIVHNMSRGGRDVIALIWWILGREVCVFVQRVDDADGEFGPSRSGGRNRRRRGPRRCKVNGRRRARIVELLGPPTPLLFQIVMDESHSPASFFLDPIKDGEHFLLLATVGQIFTRHSEAADRGRGDTSIFDMSDNAANLSRMVHLHLLHLGLGLRLYILERMHGAKDGHGGMVKQTCDDCGPLDQPDFGKCALGGGHIGWNVSQGVHRRRDTLMPSVTKLFQSQPLLMPLVESDLLSVDIRILITCLCRRSKVGDLG